jgi:hypothetical protein
LHTSAAGQELALQHTTMCIRRNAGFCSVSYTARIGTDPMSTTTSFIVGVITISVSGHDDCLVANVLIPGTVSAVTSVAVTAAASTAATCGNSNFCGGTLNLCDSGLQERTGAIVQKPPFVIGYISGATPIDTTFGFALQYSQLGCSHMAD